MCGLQLSPLKWGKKIFCKSGYAFDILDFPPFLLMSFSAANQIEKS